MIVLACTDKGLNLREAEVFCIEKDIDTGDHPQISRSASSAEMSKFDLCVFSHAWYL